MMLSGFIQEGHQRKVNWVEGAWRDVIQMGILVEDWIDARKKDDRSGKCSIPITATLSVE